MHAICAINKLQRDPKDYVSHWFKKEKFKAAYQFHISPVLSSNYWVTSPFPKPLPPKVRRMPGRPTIKRKRHPSEKEGKFSRGKFPSIGGRGRSMTCKNCGEKGHNQRSCDKEPVPLPPKVKKPRGRPRLNLGIPCSARGGSGSRGGRGGNTTGMGVSFKNGEL